MSINVTAVFRDTVIVFALTILSIVFVWFYAFLIGAEPLNMEISAISLILVDLIFKAAGFVISGCLIKVRRFKHGLIVVGAVLFVYVVIFLFFGVGLLFSMLGGPLLLVPAMVLGIGLSFFIVKSPSEPGGEETR